VFDKLLLSTPLVYPQVCIEYLHSYMGKCDYICPINITLISCNSFDDLNSQTATTEIDIEIIMWNLVNLPRYTEIGRHTVFINCSLDYDRVNFRVD